MAERFFPIVLRGQEFLFYWPRKEHGEFEKISALTLVCMEWG